MERMTGTIARGLRTPIINEGDNLENMVVDTLLKASKAESFSIKDKDILSITESVVARAQGNYASVDAIAKDIKEKYKDDTIGLVFPILSRNRFALCLEGIAKGAKRIVILLSYPADEVGNHLFDECLLDERGVNPWSDVLTEKEYRSHFGYTKHQFTGVDYVDYYKSIAKEYNTPCEIVFSNNPTTILKSTKTILVCDVHTRHRTRRVLKTGGAEKIFGLDDILKESIDNNGYNEEYGLLGSNKATDTTLKLFPRDNQLLVDNIQRQIKERTGKSVEVMVYGDGAFKDPVGKIWELADPIVSPAYTKGLEGKPNEVKLKYLADNQFSHLRGKELKDAVSSFIENKDDDLMGAKESQGTTPRRLTDLIGSLSDLVSGSGDKGTPVVYIQGYFDNFTM
ncbi:MAG TPA: coenzyme F420-0:L-glutamate ligase [Bacillota bacterium]|nr:coenzyme F420-0:L-glutamate ligase [Bacillota bacterium]